MTSKFSSLIASEFLLNIHNVKAVILLLNQGATVPFIARYRKDQTGGMEDFNIFKIQKKLSFFKDLMKRKSYIISVISSQNNLNKIIEEKIKDCWDEAKLEDIYIPFKTKRKTKAEIARQGGLEEFAEIIMKQDRNFLAGSNRFLKGDIKTIEDAKIGAKFIIAELISENPIARNRVRVLFRRKAYLISKIKKGKESSGDKYEQYFDFCEKVIKLPSHRFLAIQRAKLENIKPFKKKLASFTIVQGTFDRSSNFIIDNDYNILCNVAPKIEKGIDGNAFNICGKRSE